MVSANCELTCASRIQADVGHRTAKLWDSRTPTVRIFTAPDLSYWAHAAGLSRVDSFFPAECYDAHRFCIFGNGRPLGKRPGQLATAVPEMARWNRNGMGSSVAPGRLRRHLDGISNDRRS